uniref:Uncharacterized protein n=1 Tax=Arundo donax TaxID=35708 RepID=A0A0A8YNJ1_ARUDO
MMKLQFSQIGSWLGGNLRSGEGQVFEKGTNKPKRNI